MAEILFKLDQSWPEKLSPVERNLQHGAYRAYMLGPRQGIIVEIQNDGYFQTPDNPDPPARGWGGGNLAGKQGLIIIPVTLEQIEAYQQEHCYSSFDATMPDGTLKHYEGNDIISRYLIDVSKLPSPDIWTGTTSTGKPFERRIYEINNINNLRNMIIDRAI